MTAAARRVLVAGARAEAPRRAGHQVVGVDRDPEAHAVDVTLPVGASAVPATRSAGCCWPWPCR